MANKASDLYDGIDGPLFGKHYNGAIHAIFGTANAAYAWERGLGHDRQYFHLEDRDGNRIAVKDDLRPGHAYAILDALERRDG